MGRPFGAGQRDRHPVFDYAETVVLPEGALCQFRRAGARGAGVVRQLVVLEDRCAACGTKARGAERPL